MARRYYEVKKDTFDGLVTESGLLLKNLNLEAVEAGEAGFTDEDIICATTGGISVQDTTEWQDLGEDVDNCPVNMKEFKIMTSRSASISTSALSMTPESLRLALGAADISEDGKMVVPRTSLDQDKDFQTIYWVSDKANGGAVVAVLTNALSTGGMTVQTGKATKATLALTLTGHISINAQDVAPLTFYSINPEEEVQYNVTQTLSHVTSTWTAEKITAGAEFEATLTAESGYTMDTVTVTMGETDITSTAYTAGTGKVLIAEVTDDVVITASAEE
jgi:hypothetical protein